MADRDGMPRANNLKSDALTSINEDRLMLFGNAIHPKANRF